MMRPADRSGSAGNAKADIIALSDYVSLRTRSRLAGLTDDEYFWAPVAGCCTVRRTQSGNYLAEDPDEADDPPPFTTIAWRLWHLIGCYGGKRNPEWLGVERPPGGFEMEDPAPATAAAAIIVLQRAQAFWKDLVQALPSDAWWDPLGPVAGPYAEDDKASLVLHQLDEQIHHGAELGVLRDLYTHNKTGHSISTQLPAGLTCSAQDSPGTNRIACASDHLDQRRVRSGQDDTGGGTAPAAPGGGGV